MRKTSLLGGVVLILVLALSCAPEAPVSTPAAPKIESPEPTPVAPEAERSEQPAANEEEPATALIELKHDGGTAENWTAQGPGWGYSVQFSPPAIPFTIAEVRVYAVLAGNYVLDSTSVEIWDKGFRTLYSAETPATEFSRDPGWVAIDVPDITVNGDFRIVFFTNGEDLQAGGVRIGYDLTGNKASEVATANGTIAQWPQPMQATRPEGKTNWMIRVVGAEASPSAETTSPMKAKLTANEVVYHPATEEIEYSYYHYVPESALRRDPVRVLLYAHSAPGTVETYSDMEEYVRDREIPRMRRYADTYGYALVIMVSPRKHGDSRHSSMNMVRSVMFDNAFDTPGDEFYKRPDLVFAEVVDDFNKFLGENGYSPYPKVFMTGFSSGGWQSNRFPVLHPDRIAATAIAGAPGFLYPLDSWNGITLTYPVGTSDFDQIPGNTYSLDAFKQIPHLILKGEKDLENDPVDPQFRVFDPDHVSIINSHFGSDRVERNRRFADHLKSIGMQVTLRLYPGLKHEYTHEMLVDTFEFFEAVATLP